MSKQQIEEAVNKFFDTLDPERRERPHGNMGPRARAALAKHLAAVLGPSFDEVVEVGKEMCGRHISIHVDAVNAGDIRDICGMSCVHVCWPANDNPGKAAIEAINAAMPPEKRKPTLAERFEEVVDAATLTKRQADEKLDGHIAAVRKALEAE